MAKRSGAEGAAKVKLDTGRRGDFSRASVFDRPGEHMGHIDRVLSGFILLAQEDGVFVEAQFDFFPEAEAFDFAVVEKVAAAVGRNELDQVTFFFDRQRVPRQLLRRHAFLLRLRSDERGDPVVFRNLEKRSDRPVEGRELLQYLVAQVDLDFD